MNARVVLGFTNENTVDVEAAGLVAGRPFRRGAMELRSRLDGGDASGRFTLFDGRGSLRGRSVTETPDGAHFTGRFSVEGGSRRYARAAGTLRFRGALDSEQIPAVTVMRTRGSPSPGSAGWTSRGCAGSCASPEQPDSEALGVRDREAG